MRNECIHKELEVAPIVENAQDSCLRWSTHMQCKAMTTLIKWRALFKYESKDQREHGSEQSERIQCAPSKEDMDLN